MSFLNTDWEASAEVEFRSEWLSYWIFRGASKSRSLQLFDATGFTVDRYLATRSRSGWLLSSDEASLGRLAKINGINNDRLDVIFAPVASFDCGPIPDEFPTDYTQLETLFAKSGCAKALLNCIGGIVSGEIPWIIRVQSDQVVSIAGGTIEINTKRFSHRGIGNAEGYSRKAVLIADGFRNFPDYTHARPRLMSARIKTNMVYRHDHGWVHGRCHDSKAAILKEAKVLVFGVGSLGSGIIELLQKSGVGSFTLVDDDVFFPENIARHSLGVQSIGKNKATAMAESILSREAGVSANCHEESGEDWLSKATAYDIGSHNLIISLTADWPFDSLLEDRRRSRCHTWPPVVYGRIEPHCLAGHALLISDDSSCLRCCLQNDGIPRNGIVAPGEYKKYIPSCGGSFQPYGSTYLSSVQAMVSELCISAIIDDSMKNTYRVWLAGKKSFDELGVAISQTCPEPLRPSSIGSRQVESAPIIKCPRCSRG